MPRREAPPSLLERVRDAQTVRKLVRLVDEVVNPPGELYLGVVAARHWVAAPVETANHFDKEVSSRIVDHCKAASVGRLFAVETELGVTERECYSLPVSEEALASFNWELGLMYCALVPPGLEWLILCTRDEHFAVAGTEEFVEAILGKPLAQALKEFGDFAADAAWSATEREFLRGVCERYTAAHTGRLEI